MEHNFEANFFTMLELLDAGGRLEVEGACTKVSFPANHVIYDQGDPSNALYIVSAGTVEALTKSPDGKQTRSVAFMGKGEFFGDLGILTNHPRLAGVRTCEPVKLLQIEKLAFQRLLEKVPKMGAYFSRNLARRLHETSTTAHLNVYSLDLSGNLQHFDLLTIFQAITSMGRSGELFLHNAANELIGSFYFRNGRAENARFVHLVGLEAIWEGFLQSTTAGTFIFRVRDEPSAPPFGEENKIGLESVDLLMQGVTRRDLYQALPEPLRKMEGRLSRKAASLSWSEPETQPLAERIWELIAKRPQPLDSLWRRVNFSSLSFLEVVNQLVTTEQAEFCNRGTGGGKVRVPVNTDPASDFFAFLEALDEPSRKEVEAACTKLSIEPHQLVYEQGSEADGLYIVLSGEVEAVTFSPDGKLSRSVAVMSRGDFFGDLAILTGQPRLAAVRSREGARVLYIEKKTFLGLMKKIPGLGLFFSQILARRLFATSTEAHRNVYAIDLNGNLQRFDLLTIVQAITGMGHTGELRLNNSANELLGSFFFRKGRVEHARFGHLLGLEAIWQGFIESTSEGTFSFMSIDAPTIPFPDGHKIDMESTSLLLEGVGKRDTYQGMPETLRQMEGKLARMAESLDWKTEETRVVAEQIWKLISEPRPLRGLWLQLNYSAISFLEVVMEMGMNSQAELFVDEKTA